MIKKKIYIAGKVTGELIAECTMKFGTAQKQIEARGYEVINPLEVVNDWTATWNDAMRKCIPALAECDGLLLLPDYNESKGARAELQMAYVLDIEVFSDINDINI